MMAILQYLAQPSLIEILHGACAGSFQLWYAIIIKEQGRTAVYWTKVWGDTLVSSLEPKDGAANLTEEPQRRLIVATRLAGRTAANSAMINRADKNMQIETGSALPI